MRAALVLALMAAAFAGTCGNAAASEYVRTYDTTPIVDVRIDQGFAAAVAYWGRSPACPIAVLGMSIRLVGVGEPTNATAVASAELGGCRMWFDRDRLATASSRAVCNTTVHEFGHALGYEHAAYPDDPAGVMLGGPAPQCGSEPPGPVTVPKVVPKRDGRTRSARNRADRKWCRRHSDLCFLRYQALAGESLSDAVYFRLVGLHPTVTYE